MSCSSPSWTCDATRSTRAAWWGPHWTRAWARGCSPKALAAGAATGRPTSARTASGCSRTSTGVRGPVPPTVPRCAARSTLVPPPPVPPPTRACAAAACLYSWAGVGQEKEGRHAAARAGLLTQAHAAVELQTCSGNHCRLGSCGDTRLAPCASDPGSRCTRGKGEALGPEGRPGHGVLFWAASPWTPGQSGSVRPPSGWGLTGTPTPAPGAGIKAPEGSVGASRDRGPTGALLHTTKCQLDQPINLN